MIGVKQIGAGGGGSAMEQDNNDIVKTINTQTSSLSRLVDTITSAVNYTEPYDISETESLWFVFLFTNGVTIRYKLLKKGKGTYGNGGTPITFSELLFISQSQTNVADLENLETTDIIFIEDLQGMTITQYVNQANPAYTIKPKADGETIFKVGMLDKITYWFVGDSGKYGQGFLQSEPLDFQLLQESVPVVQTPIFRELIQSKQQLFQNFRSDTVYAIDGDFLLTDGEYITHTGNLTFDGWGYDISRIRKNVAGQSIFKSAVGGSGNLSLNKLEINSGASSVFDNTDSNGTHAVEINDVNFNNCSSLGRLRGFRQFTGTTLGFYSCANGLQFSGTWNGFKLTNSNCFTFGNAGTLFRKDADTLFKNRFFAELNADFSLGSKLADFVENNFQSDELFQMNSSMIKYNGTINDKNASALVPNLSANNKKCLWRSNVGLPDTALEKFVEDTAVTGSFVVNWLYDTFILTMTGNTLFSETNLPATGKNTEEIKIFLQGNFTPTFPASWNANKVGTYKKGELNQITLKFLKGGLYFMKIDNSLTIYPAPDVSGILPQSIIPEATSQLNVYGSFFTPATIVSINGQVVNTVTFVNQGHLILSVTAGSVEGDFALSVSNGTEVTYPNKIPVYLGTVFVPTEDNWTDITGSFDGSEDGRAKVVSYNVPGSAFWNQAIDWTKNFAIRFNIENTPLGSAIGYYQRTFIGLHNADNSLLFGVAVTPDGGSVYIGTMPYGWENVIRYDFPTFQQSFNRLAQDNFEVRWQNGTFALYKNSTLVRVIPNPPTQNLKLKASVQGFNIKNIKYIELAN